MGAKSRGNFSIGQGVSQERWDEIFKKKCDCERKNAAGECVVHLCPECNEKFTKQVYEVLHGKTDIHL
jgi:hypothetical protein